MKQLNNSILLAGVFSTLIISPSFAESISEDDGLLDLSLEELISLDVPDVTSVSRKKQRLMDSAAAIYVITNDDIRRSGVTSIPEALRMVPGMQVARLNGNTWSISTRGFNYIFANKLLVLIDGRTVYSPLFSGVNWDVQDTMLEDIDRIEVIRGPGAALWGANAVNGVINIITKYAADTQGGLLSAGFGSEEKAFGAYRYGGKFGDDGHYRAYVKAFERDALHPSDTVENPADDWNMQRAGFRTEWQAQSGADITVQGDIYQGTTRPPLRIADPDLSSSAFVTLTDKSRDQKGGNISAHFKKVLSDTSDYSLRAIYDNYQNFDYRITEKRDTLDFEFQHYFKPWAKHNLVWGASYRATFYEIDKTKYMYFLDGSEKETNHLYNIFVQDDIVLNSKWDLTLSSRFEHNDFTGFEVQPNARLTWRPTENRTFWSAISRAVKTPSLSDTKLQTNGITISGRNPTYVVPISGNENLKSEKLTAFELGYREVFNQSLRFDSTIFFNQYKDIQAYDQGFECPTGNLEFRDGVYVCYQPGITNPVIIPSQLTNGIEAQSYGFETVIDWQAKNWWKLQFTYSWFNIEATPNKADEYGFLQANKELIENQSPNHTANIRSNMNLPDNWYLDVWLRYMSPIKSAGVSAHSTMDFRLAKKLSDNVEVSFIGQNIFDSSRLEFSETLSGLGATEIERAWYLQLRWQH